VLALLVVRNVLRNLSRLAPMIVIIVAVFVVMLTGNAVLSASGDALYGTYGRLVAGDLSVSATAESNFTVFGSDQLLIGEYLIPPTIPEYSRLRDIAADFEEVRATAGLVTSAANVNIDGSRRNKTVFGVDFGEYREMFPDLTLVAGRFPDAGEPGIVVQEDRVPQEGTAEDILGRPALLAGGSGSSGGSFTLREVPVTGVFRYPVDDELLNGVVLTDVDTARALSGYLYGALEMVELSQEDEAVLNAEVDDLFGTSDQGFGEPQGSADVAPPAAESDNLDDMFGSSDSAGAPAAEGGAASDEPAGTDDAAGTGSGESQAESDAVDIEALLGGGDGTARAPETDGASDPSATTDGVDATVDVATADQSPTAAADRARQTIAGSWNFLLVSLYDRGDRPAVMRALHSAGFTEEEGYRVRDWYRTVGGNASLVRYLQILFNAGLIFVAIGAAIIATNALVLSVLERTGEIGTMRALGAGRPRVALMITMETLLVVMGAAAAGILLGVGATQLLNDAEYVVANQYIAILFGGEPVQGQVTASLVIAHLAAAAALTAVAVIYPLKKALTVSPREAMAA
jgi:ABC-type antimicrobial peptide transport system permease subunit